MAAMDRETLVRILTKAPGVAGKEPRFEVGDQHRLTLYLGRPGRAMEVRDVRALDLESDFIAVDGGDQGTLYCALEDVHAVAVQSNERGRERRAGFS
ncbi:MAG: hypothetical protein ACOC97_00375 [Myxococcota bacterium]